MVGGVGGMRGGRNLGYSPVTYLSIHKETQRLNI